MKSNILINCLVLFYNVGIFPSDILTFFIFIDLHACSEVFATEPDIFSFVAFLFRRIPCSLLIDWKLPQELLLTK